MANEQNKTSRPQHSEVGPAIGVAIVVVLLVIGGVYFFAQQDMGSEGPTNTEELRTTTSSDEIVDIEADLEEDFENIDRELEDIEQELETMEEEQAE